MLQKFWPATGYTRYGQLGFFSVQSLSYTGLDALIRLLTSLPSEVRQLMARGQRTCSANNRPSEHKASVIPVAQRWTWGWNSTPSKGGIHMYFFNGNSFIWWILLLYRGVRFVRISGKRVLPCRCHDWHNKNPTKYLWHRNPIIGPSTSSVSLRIDVLSQIWLKHLRLWRKTKTSRFNSTWYMFFQIRIIHTFEYIIFVFLSMWQFLPLIFTTRACTGHRIVINKIYKFIF